MASLNLQTDMDSFGVRLDHFLTRNEGLPTRSQFSARNLKVISGDKELKMSLRLKGNEYLTVTWDDEVPSHLEAIRMDLEILYEDNDTLVINKPRGLSVHPGTGKPVPTLVHGIMGYLTEPSEAWEAPERPGIVHRLDKDTTGIILCAKNTKALEFYSKQFRERKVRKTYIALVRGTLPRSTGRVENLLGRDPKHRQRFAVVASGGKNAITEYVIREKREGLALVELNLLTGRTHQLRVHLAHLKCPIIGDILYGRGQKPPLMLHARLLELTLTDGTLKTLVAPLHSSFLERLIEVGFSTLDLAKG